jgi:hypothetical protein
MTASHETIRRALHDSAHETAVRPGSVHAAIRRGRMRRNRHRASVGALATVGVVATGVAVVQLREPGRVEVGEVGPASPSTAPSPAPAWTWEAAETTSFPAGEIVDSFVVAGDATYAVSVDGMSGISEGTGALWRSEDGIVWERRRVDDGELAVTSVASDGTRLLAAGTSADAPVLASSTDQGATFATTPLPIDLDAYAIGSIRPFVNTEVAHRDGVTVVATSIRSFAEAADLGVTIAPDEVATSSADGVSVCAVDTEAQAAPSPVATRVPALAGSCRLETWASLGLTDEQIAGVLGTVKVFTVNGDGTPIEVTIDRAPDGVTDLNVAAGRSGFDLAVGVDTGLLTAASTDGTTWTPFASVDPGLATPPSGSGGRLGDELGVFAQALSSEIDPQFAVSTAAGGWTITDLRALVEPLPADATTWRAAATIGPFGVVAVIGIGSDDESPPGYRVVTSTDGAAWSVSDVDALVGGEQSVRMAVTTETSVVFPLVSLGPGGTTRVLVGRHA